MCNKIRNAFINGQVYWACPDLYNIVFKSKISSYNRAVILYQSCRDISHKYIVLEKEPIKWKH